MNYTSIEQSKHLLELGLSPESADACYDVGYGQTKAHIECENFISYFTNDEYPELEDRYVPCWSIGALLELIPNITLDGDRFLPVLYIDGKYFTLVYQHMTTIFRSEYGKDIIVPIYKMMCYLLENNYIKAE